MGFLGQAVLELWHSSKNLPPMNFRGLCATSKLASNFLQFYRGHFLHEPHHQKKYSLFEVGGGARNTLRWG